MADSQMVQWYNGTWYSIDGRTVATTADPVSEVGSSQLGMGVLGCTCIYTNPVGYGNLETIQVYTQIVRHSHLALSPSKSPNPD